MSAIDSKMRFAKTHEWLLMDESGIATIGITDYAQRTLGDVVYIELPEPGTKVESSEKVALVESVKAASDIYTPISGEVVEVNQALVDTPDLINAEPFGTGWLYKIKPKDVGELDFLIDEVSYNASCD